MVVRVVNKDGIPIPKEHKIFFPKIMRNGDGEIILFTTMSTGILLKTKTDTPLKLVCNIKIDEYTEYNNVISIRINRIFKDATGYVDPYIYEAKDGEIILRTSRHESIYMDTFYNQTYRIFKHIGYRYFRNSVVTDETKSRNVYRDSILIQNYPNEIGLPVHYNLYKKPMNTNLYHT